MRIGVNQTDSSRLIVVPREYPMQARAVIVSFVSGKNTANNIEPVRELCGSSPSVTPASATPASAVSPRHACIPDPLPFGSTAAAWGGQAIPSTSVAVFPLREPKSDTDPVDFGPRY